MSLFQCYIVLTFLSCTMALQCYKCGQYNDGVGSITPCINETYTKLITCSQRSSGYCIKYMSEGTIVRDCVHKCTEKGILSPCCKRHGISFLNDIILSVNIVFTTGTFIFEIFK
ncbi:hypothetical protein ABEB36_015013 [Hypothenemus hampei]|uniref:Uncharacterized protein n=1 Tax=Hypothenemus hampei TaxID=57062 RepID=A0ABD1E1V0_HYPHA